MSGSGQDPRSHDPATRETIPPGGKIDSQGKSTAAATAIPDRLGRYTIQRPLGAGGMGVVYLAHDEQLGRQVALKIPTAKVADSPKLLERLYREARLAATLTHPNICPVYDVGEIDGRHYISMAYIEGRPLSDFVRPEKLLPERQAASLVRRIALAVQHAHEMGVIHRDLKPSNVMIDRRREPIIMDFGLARQFDKDADSRLTQHGAILGSPAYMSPEQVDGDVERIGPASDIYSLGVMLYEMLTAQLPFSGSMASIMGQILTSEPAAPSEIRPELSFQLETICLRMMSRNIDARYASMEPVADALGSYLKQTRAEEAVARESAELPAFGSSEDEYQFRMPRRAAATKARWFEPNRKFWLGTAATGVVVGLCVWLAFALSGSWRDSGEDAATPGSSDLADTVPLTRSSTKTESPALAIAPFDVKQAKQHQQAWAVHLGTPVETTNSIGMKLKLIPAGEFQMGSPDSGSDARDREKPQHLVQITKPFYLGVYEITQQQYEKVMGKNPTRFKGAKNPVDSMTWTEAVEFCRRLSELPEEKAAGHVYRLPTEAEWEYSCRAGTTTKYSLGDSDSQLGEYAWFEKNSGDTTHPVGQKKVNSWGLCDMHGNVWEWCQDWYGSYPSGSVTDPQGPKSGSRRSLRGGAFNYQPSHVRSAVRDYALPGGRATVFGFRVARTYNLSPAPVAKQKARPPAKKTVASKLPKKKELVLGFALSLPGHTDCVTEVAWSPEGERLASGSFDRTVKVWDAASGKLLATLQGHTDVVHGLAFSPDGKRLASSSWDRTVKVWDADSGGLVGTLRGHNNPVGCVAWSPDGKQLASSSDDRTVKVWDVASSMLLATLQGHKSDITGVAWSPDGKRLASGSLDKTVKVWDVTSGGLVDTLHGHTDRIDDVAWSPDGKRLASSSWDRTVKVWDADSGGLVATLRGHNNAVRCVAFSPDGKQLASGSSDRTVKVWDVASSKLLATLQGHTDGVWQISWSPDGKRLVSGSQDKTVKVWDLEALGSARVKAAATAHAIVSQAAVTLKEDGAFSGRLSFSPNGRRLATGIGDNTVRVWDSFTGEELFSRKGHTAAVSDVAFSPDGKRLASASHDGTVKVWDAVLDQDPVTLKSDDEWVRCIAFSADGKWLASAGDNRLVNVWNVSTGELSATLKGHTSSVKAVSFGADGQRVASGSYDRTVKVWDVATGKALLTLEGHTDRVYSVSFSPDAKRLASASRDGTVKVWDTVTGQELLTLTEDGHWVHGLSFSPDGKRLATASSAKTVKVWNASTGQEVLRLKGHADRVFSVAFSPDGNRLASVSVDKTVKVWNLETAATPTPPPKPLPKGPPLGPVPPVGVAPFDAAQAKAHQQAWAKYLDVPRAFTLKTRFATPLNVEFVLIPPGRFLMGTSPNAKALPKETPEILSESRPQHPVVITRPFYISKYEITQIDFRSVMGGGKTPVNGDGRQLPATQIYWGWCSQFCEQVTRKGVAEVPGAQLRLPTEAEWEYACRAGTTTRFWFGDTVTASQAMLRLRGISSRLVPIDSFAPNPFGLFQVHGNVHEWCHDWHGTDYYEESPLEDPFGPANGEKRILRGGGCHNPPFGATSSWRQSYGPDTRGSNIGFRPVLTVPQILLKR